MRNLDLKEKAVPRDEYREVLSRLDGLEKDVSAILHPPFSILHHDGHCPVHALRQRTALVPTCQTLT